MEILSGLIVLVVICALVALAFRPLEGPHRFHDADVDGEPD